MICRLTLLIIFLLSLHFFTYGQVGSVAGTVTEASRNMTLSGALITIESSGLTAVSDESGRFVLQGIRPGPVRINAAYLGFETVSEEITVLENKTVSWNPVLKLADQSYTVTVEAGSDSVGQARALNDQKNSINLVNLVASDQIGSFPDPNAAEAIQRVPGIVVQRDQGEGRYVLIRGTEPRLSATTINGERIGTTENTSRQIPLDTIPADLLGAIEVTKAFTPDMEGDSIGGRVNLITKRAPASRQIALTFASGFNSLVNKRIDDYSGAYGQRFFRQKLGFIGSGNFYRTRRGSQDIEPAYTSTLALNSLDLRDYHLTRTRKGGTFDLDYNISPGAEIYLRGLFSEYEDRELRYRLRELISNSRLERTLRQRYHDSVQDAFAAGGKHTLAGSWTAAWRASYSRATLVTPNRIESTFRQTGVAFSPNVSPLTIDPNNIQANPQNQNLNNFNFVQNAIQNDRAYERNLAGGLDLSAPTRFTKRAIGLFKFGLKIRDASRTRDVATLTQTPRSGITIRLIDQAQQGYAPPNNFLGGKYREFGTLFPDPDKMLVISRDPSLLNSVAGATGDSGSYRARERVSAGYAMQELYLGEKTTILGGVRLEWTSTKYGAPQYRLGSGGTVLSRTFFEGTNDYLNVLPSIHFRQQLFKDTPLRVSYSRSLARPNYNDLAPFTLQDTSALTISRGNPALKVTTADNFDLSLEHYFQSVGIISGGFFYKRLDNYIYARTSTEAIGTDIYRVTQPVNGSRASLYGIELNLVRRLDFLPGILKGVDVYVNYTRVKSKAVLPRGDFVLPSQAKNMGNLALGYNFKGFSTKLSANYQGEYPLAIGPTATADNWLDRRWQVDYSISQRLGKHLKVFADFLNLANQPYRVYLGTYRNRPIQQEIYKQWGIIGIKLNF